MTHAATDTWLSLSKTCLWHTVQKTSLFFENLYSCPNLQRPTNLQDRTVPGTWQNSNRQTCLTRKHRKLWESEKSLGLTTPLQPLGLHCLSTKQAEMGWKLREPPPSPWKRGDETGEWFVLWVTVSKHTSWHWRVGRQGGRHQPCCRWSPTKEMSNPTLGTWHCLHPHGPFHWRSGVRIKSLFGYLLAADVRSPGSFSQQCAASDYLFDTALAAPLYLETNSYMIQLSKYQRQGRDVFSSGIWSLQKEVPYLRGT